MASAGLGRMGWAWCEEVSKPSHGDFGARRSSRRAGQRTSVWSRRVEASGAVTMEGRLLRTRKSQGSWSRYQIDPGNLSKWRGGAVRRPSTERAAVGTWQLKNMLPIWYIVYREEKEEDAAEEGKECCWNPNSGCLHADSGDLAPWVTAGCIEEQSGPRKLGMQ